MKAKKQRDQKLRSLQSTLNCAIGKLDLRGDDKQITKAMCIVDAVVEAAIFGEGISTDQAFNRGVKQARSTL